MKFNKDIKVYGDTSYRGDCPKEDAEQITFFNILRRDYPEIARLALHIKNEGKRTNAQAQKEKANGLLTGAPDLLVIGSPTLVIELKRLDHTKSRWQPNQQETLEEAQKSGAFACVALGHKAALEALKDWINVAG